MKRKRGIKAKRRLTRMLCALVCIAALFSLTVPAYAGGTEIGTNVTITVEEGLEITAQTEDFTLAVGGSQELRIEVSGVAPFTYSWALSADGGASWSPLPGVGILPSYTIINAQANVPAELAYQYRVTVTNSAHESTSAVIRVLVSDDYEYRTSADAASSAAAPPTVSGYLHDATVLHVEPIQPQTDLPAEVWAAMSARIGSGETYIEPYNIYFTNSAGEAVVYHGELEIKVNVGAAYNGMTVRVVHYHTPTGAVETLIGRVINGVVAVTVHDLCPFMVVVPESTVHVIAATAGTGGSISPAGKVNVGHGGGMHFYFIPDSGYALDKVLLDGVETAVTGNSYQFTNVTEAHTISASFKALPPPAAYCTITARAGAGGSISPEGSTQVAQGGSQTFSFIPDAGYEIDGVLIDGSETAVAGSSYRFTDVRVNHSISVSFKRVATPPPAVIYYTVSAAAGANGSISPAGSVSVAEGGAQRFTFAPDAGYEVDEVVVDGAAAAVSGGSYQFEDIRAGHTISVSFKKAATPPPPVIYYSISAGSGANGSISPSGSVDVASGGEQIFYLIADEGYEIDTLTVDGSPAEANGGSYRFENIRENHTIHVTYKERPAAAVYHTITAEAGAGGKISPSGSVRAIEGGAADFCFIPDEGYEVAEVLIDGAAVELASNEYCFEGVSQGHAIHVSFKKSEPASVTFFTVTAGAGEHGEISPAVELQVALGGSQTFYFIPDAGYELEAVYINGKKQEIKESPFTVDNITGDTEISVTFRVASVAPADGETDCRCLWAGLFGDCAVCGLLGRCIDPWCWIIPLALLAFAVAAAIIRRRAKTKDKNIEDTTKPRL